jgi:hypothetical protein
MDLSTEVTSLFHLGHKLKVGNSCRLLEQSLLHSTNGKQIRYWEIKGNRREKKIVICDEIAFCYTERKWKFFLTPLFSFKFLDRPAKNNIDNTDLACTYKTRIIFRRVEIHFRVLVTFHPIFALY